MVGKVLVVFIIVTAFSVVGAVADQDNWTNAHATFYGDMKGTGTMKGACGYGDLFEHSYGIEIMALSAVLFNKGLTCGVCYEIQCDNSKWCLNNTIQVTATDFCPDQNWCKPPLQHFDLSQPMFGKIAKYEGGIVPIMYRKVQCTKTRGVKFEIKGNKNWMVVLVYNVGGVGDVKDVKIKGSNTKWIQMSRDWGQNWETGTQLVGQSLSFRVTTSDGVLLQSEDVAPIDWKFGNVYEGKQF